MAGRTFRRWEDVRRSTEEADPPTTMPAPAIKEQRAKADKLTQALLSSISTPAADREAERAAEGVQDDGGASNQIRIRAPKRTVTAAFGDARTGTDADTATKTAKRTEKDDANALASLGLLNQEEVEDPRSVRYRRRVEEAQRLCPIPENEGPEARLAREVELNLSNDSDEEAWPPITAYKDDVDDPIEEHASQQDIIDRYLRIKRGGRIPPRPIPSDVAEMDEMDKMLWTWKSQGRKWNDIRDEHRRMSGKAVAPSTLSVRFSKMVKKFALDGKAADIDPRVFAQIPYFKCFIRMSNIVNEDIVLMQIKKEVEDEREPQLWAAIAKRFTMAMDREAKPYDAEELRKRYKAFINTSRGTNQERLLKIKPANEAELKAGGKLRTLNTSVVGQQGAIAPPVTRATGPAESYNPAGLSLLNYNGLSESHLDTRSDDEASKDEVVPPPTDTKRNDRVSMGEAVPPPKVHDNPAKDPPFLPDDYIPPSLMYSRVHEDPKEVLPSDSEEEEEADEYDRPSYYGEEEEEDDYARSSYYEEEDEEEDEYDRPSYYDEEDDYEPPTHHRANIAPGDSDYEERQRLMSLLQNEMINEMNSAEYGDDEMEKEDDDDGADGGCDNEDEAMAEDEE